MEGFAYGFPTYVFIERNSANSAVLHPYPETKIEAVRDALDDAGYDMEILGKGDINTGRERAGEGIYFTEQPFPDEVLGDLADALIVRGFGAFAYSLIESSFDSGAKISLFTRMGKNIVQAGNRVIMTHMYIGEIEGKKEARTWFFGSPTDLAEAEMLSLSRFSTQPVHDVHGMAAIEIVHADYSQGFLSHTELMSAMLNVLGKSGYNGPAFVTDSSII